MKDVLFPFASIFSLYKVSLLKKRSGKVPQIGYLNHSGDLFALAQVVMYLRKLSVLECLGDVQRSITISKKGLAFAKKMHDANLLSSFLRNLGVAYWGLGKNEEALELFNDLLHIAEKSNSKSLRLVATGNIGLVRFWMGHNEAAMKYFSRALAIAMELDDKRNVSIAYESIGQTHKEMGHHKEALSYYDKALKIAIEQGNRRGEGILYGNIGDLYYDERKYKLAFEYFGKAQSIASEAQDRRSECIWLANRGSLHTILGEEEKGVPFLEKSLEIAEQLQLPGSEKICLRELTRAHIALGNLSVAEELSLHGAELSRKTKDRQNQVWFLTLIGIIAIRNRSMGKAITNLKNAEKIAEPAEDTWQLFRAKLFLKRAQFLKRKSMTALEGIRSMVDSIQAHEKGAGEVESLKEEEVIAEAYIICGSCLREMGKGKEAKEYDKRARALIEKYKLYSLRRQLKVKS